MKWWLQREEEEDRCRYFLKREKEQEEGEKAIAKMDIFMWKKIQRKSR
jgi:hypothetical protein